MTKKTATNAAAKKVSISSRLKAKGRDWPKKADAPKSNGVPMPVSACKSILPNLRGGKHEKFEQKMRVEYI